MRSVPHKLAIPDEPKKWPRLVIAYLQVLIPVVACIKLLELNSVLLVFAICGGVKICSEFVSLKVCSEWACYSNIIFSWQKLALLIEVSEI